MYLSTRISRLYKRGHFLSLSLHICVCVCMCVCVGLVFQSLFCVCGGGGMEGLFPSWISKLFLISLIYFSFFLFFDDIPPPCNSYKAAPISSSLCNVYVCVCVCVCVFVTFYLCTSYFNRIAKYLDYWYLCINIY